MRMPHSLASKSLLVGLLLVPSACGGTDPIVCTDQFVYGLVVEVVDRNTGEPRASGATLTLQDGAWVEETTDSFDGLTMLGAGERPGVYDVTVVRPGYQTWTRPGITVTADECHVIPVTLRAELVPTP